MNLVTLLRDNMDELLDRAQGTLSRADLRHYKEIGEEATRAKLAALYDLVVKSLSTRDLIPMIEYVRGIAEERYSEGFGIQEIQTAFNVLEEGMWNLIIKDLEPGKLAEAIGLISTVLGAGKDTLASTYVALASNRKAPSLNLLALFKGTDSCGEDIG